jgi:hypothetical protein
VQETYVNQYVPNCRKWATDTARQTMLRGLRYDMGETVLSRVGDPNSHRKDLTAVDRLALTPANVARLVGSPGFMLLPCSTRYSWRRVLVVSLLDMI